MADKPQDPKATDGQQEPQQDGTQEPDQEAFWTRFKEETAKVVDARLADRDKKRSDEGTRRSSQKRTTIPGVIADIMFGKEKA